MGSYGAHKAEQLDQANARIVELEASLRSARDALGEMDLELERSETARDEQTRMTAAASQEIARLKNLADARLMGLEAAGKIMREVVDSIESHDIPYADDSDIAKLRSAADFLGGSE